jgi:hypothetical protein
MLSLDQIDKSDRVVIEREILVRRKLIGEMVGTLYPSNPSSCHQSKESSNR